MIPGAGRPLLPLQATPGRPLTPTPGAMVGAPMTQVPQLPPPGQGVRTLQAPQAQQARAVGGQIGGMTPLGMKLVNNLMNPQQPQLPTQVQPGAPMATAAQSYAAGTGGSYSDVGGLFGESGGGWMGAAGGASPVSPYGASAVGALL